LTRHSALNPAREAAELADPFRPYDKFVGAIAHARDVDHWVNFADRCHDTLRSKTKPLEIGYFGDEASNE
jgi:hypothetical protein